MCGSLLGSELVEERPSRPLPQDQAKPATIRSGTVSVLVPVVLARLEAKRRQGLLYVGRRTTGKGSSRRP